MVYDAAATVELPTLGELMVLAWLGRGVIVVGVGVVRILVTGLLLLGVGSCGDVMVTGYDWVRVTLHERCLLCRSSVLMVPTLDSR